MTSLAARLLLVTVLLALVPLCCDDGLPADSRSEELAADSGGICLWADDPERDYIIAGVIILLFLGSILVALYYIALKEED